MKTLPISPVVLAPLILLVLLFGALLVVGKVPLHYNLRNLVVRWRMSLLTGLAFTLVIALLTVMMAQVTGYQPGEFIHTLGDAHLYLNHLEQARLQLSRAPRPLPRLQLNPAVTDIFAFRYEDFTLTGYNPHPHIKAQVAV